MTTQTTKYESLWKGPETVADFIELLSTFPKEWPVKVSPSAGGGIGIEHRDIKGEPVVAIFGKNGGRFGDNPLTEEEYKKQSEQFLSQFNDPYYSYTTIHGDHRMYHPSGINDTCYGTHYDRRVIERMVKEGLVHIDQKEIERVAYIDR
jgi:hypothetical protein